MFCSGFFLHEICLSTLTSGINPQKLNDEEGLRCAEMHYKSNNNKLETKMDLHIPVPPAMQRKLFLPKALLSTFLK